MVLNCLRKNTFNEDFVKKPTVGGELLKLQVKVFSTWGNLVHLGVAVNF